MVRTLDLIIPCHNEEESIQSLFEKLNSVLLGWKSYKFNLIFVDDGSTDFTLSKIKLVAPSKFDVRIISLSRNFGHQQAISAGLSVSKGDAAIILDADLQDPLEILEDMLHEWESGSEVVIGVRQERPGETFFKKITAFLFYRLLSITSDTELVKDSGDFRLVDKKIIKILKCLPEQTPYFRGLTSWVGFKKTVINYKREERLHGNTKYNWKKMSKLAQDAIFGYSNLPLRISLIFSVLMFGLATVILARNLYFRFFTESWSPGNSAIFLAIVFIAAAQFLTLWMIGQYVSRIYFEVLNRPRFIVKNEFIWNQKKKKWGEVEPSY